MMLIVDANSHKTKRNRINDKQATRIMDVTINASIFMLEYRQK